MRLVLFLIGCAIASIAACAPAHSQNEFVLNVALPGPVNHSKGAAIDGYATIVEDWLYEPLMRVADDGSSSPDLASAVEDLGGGRVRIHLRPGSTFSDGTPVTLDDVARSATANDLRVELERDALILSSTVLGVSPTSILPTVVVTKMNGTERIGSGPFQIVELDSQHILLKRRVPAAGRINTVRATSYDGPREALARVLRGDANLLPQIEAREVEFFEGVAHLRVLRGPDPHSVAINLNQRLPLDERLAIARALPIAELSRTAFGESCRPWGRGGAGGALPPGGALNVLSLGNDAELAKLGLAVRRTLADRGGALQRPGMEGLMSAMGTGDYDLAVTTPLVWPLGMASLILHTGSHRNFFHYSNAGVDAALEQGNWLHVLDALEQDPPLVFVCTRERISIVDARLKNARLGPWGLLETLPDWEVGE